MFERLTEPARAAVRDARVQAREMSHQYVGTEHLLLALLQPQALPASRILHGFGLTVEGVRADIARRLGDSRLITDAEAAALQAIGIDIRMIEAKIEEAFGPGALEPEAPPNRHRLFRRPAPGTPPGNGGQRNQVRWAPRARKVLELSLREALRLRQDAIGTEHILLGLIREGQGLAAQVIVESGVDLADLRRATEESCRAAA